MCPYQVRDLGVVVKNNTSILYEQTQNLIINMNLDIEIVNPISLTKGEMMKECKNSSFLKEQYVNICLVHIQITVDLKKKNIKTLAIVYLA